MPPVRNSNQNPIRQTQQLEFQTFQERDSSPKRVSVSIEKIGWTLPRTTSRNEEAEEVVVGVGVAMVVEEEVV